MRLKLTRLVLVTCVALLGIMTLQVFWLVKQYGEQRNKLFALADNALMETQIFTGVNAGLNRTVQSLAGDMLQQHKYFARNSSGKVDTILSKVYHINMYPETLQAGTKDEVVHELLKLAGIDSSGKRIYNLEEYKARVSASLKAKGVDIPFEMALIDFNGKVVKSTVDTASFRRIKLKTNNQFSLPVTLAPRLSGRAQLAFPEAVFYLLKGMWVILLLSSCLIVLCAFSFTYMVALFYKQKRLAEIRNDFMNNMTHELKTPISAVSVALELLQDSSVVMAEQEKDEYFRIAGNELGRLTGLVDKVLRMSALEKRAVKIKPSRFSVREWVEEVLTAVRPLTEAINAKTSLEIRPERLLMTADRDQMSSILQNLLENAVKYADKRKPFPDIRIEAGTEGNIVYFKVTDNGIGIAPQHLDRIFDKFFRVPTGDQHETKGYGLGLSYVGEIVKLHKGDVQVDSELRKGTTFTIRIPQSV